MKHQELNLEYFDILQFFIHCSVLYDDVSFLYSGIINRQHEWSIVAFDSQFTRTDIDGIRDTFRENTVEYNGQLPFYGGFIGSISYDQEFLFRWYNHAVLYHHPTQKTYAVFDDDEFVNEVRKIWLTEKVVTRFTVHDGELSFRPLSTRYWYTHAFETIKKYITDGDVYQMNLTQQFEAEFCGSTPELFIRLVHANPAEMSACILGENMDVLSCSPERFLRHNNGYLHTYPIKGTIGRTSDNVLNKKSIQQLFENIKEEAELNMITDLLRNDLGMVCEPGTVKIMAHREIMKCATVFHTYSHISGKLTANLTPFDAFLRMFPGGSITGCPKKRACEIIAELEPYKRGMYTGCIGYISAHGAIDFNIAIRTLVRNNNTLRLGVGGGIVIDSECESEYQESLAKARAFFTLKDA